MLAARTGAILFTAGVSLALPLIATLLRDERRAAIQPAIIMPDIPGMRGSEADATPAQVLEPGC